MKELLSRLLSRKNIRCQQSKAGQAGLYLSSGDTPGFSSAPTRQTNSSTHSSTQKQSSAAGKTHPEAP